MWWLSFPRVAAIPRVERMLYVGQQLSRGTAPEHPAKQELWCWWVSVGCGIWDMGCAHGHILVCLWFGGNMSMADGFTQGPPSTVDWAACRNAGLGGRVQLELRSRRSGWLHNACSSSCVPVSTCRGTGA
jgi:hypothetical protein